MCVAGHLAAQSPLLHEEGQSPTAQGRRDRQRTSLHQKAQSVVVRQCGQLLPQGGHRQVHRREQSSDQENVRRASGASDCQDLGPGGEDLQPGEEVQEGRTGGHHGGAAGRAEGGGQSRSSLPTGPATATARCGPSSTTRSSSRPSTKRSAGATRRPGVTETARVNRSTSGTDCSRTTPTTTVPGSSWTGSSSPPAVSADATKILS